MSIQTFKMEHHNIVFIPSNLESIVQSETLLLLRRLN